MDGDATPPAQRRRSQGVAESKSGGGGGGDGGDGGGGGRAAHRQAHGEEFRDEGGDLPAAGAGPPSRVHGGQ